MFYAHRYLNKKRKKREVFFIDFCVITGLVRRVHKERNN